METLETLETAKTLETPTTPNQPANPYLVNLKRFLWEDTENRYRLSSWLFLRCLGVIYFIAFASFAVQAIGLIGSNGITPIQDTLPRVEAIYQGTSHFTNFPTLFWLDASDTVIKVLCYSGMLCALLLILRVAPALMLVTLWAFYLSIVTAGLVFMSFQWDILLLEVGFLAIFFAPWNFRPTLIDRHAPPRLTIWLFRWLLFRLMFASGAVKLLSHDPNWQNLTALSFHYETQPLPTPLAWYAYQLPLDIQKISTAMVFIIELFVPFFFLLPDHFRWFRRLRMAAGVMTIGLQMLILLTGNYTFFNWLTIALCLLLFDDDFFRRFFPKRLTVLLNREILPTSKIRVGITVLVTIFIFMQSTLLFQSQLRQKLIPDYATDILEDTRPFRLTNTYGLFAVMTTTHPTLIVEGSNDRTEWKTYEFRYQPQDPRKMPPIVAPHQPRLDWQMWFAALGSYQGNPWLLSFVRRLLEGSPSVEGLLKNNPFPDKPPRYIRIQIYRYTFTDSQTRRETGAWWKTTLLGEYLPPVSLENFN